MCGVSYLLLKSHKNPSQKKKKNLGRGIYKKILEDNSFLLKAFDESYFRVTIQPMSLKSKSITNVYRSES